MMKKENVLVFLFTIFSINFFSQSTLVSGQVVDEGGNPLPGVTVLVEGTNRGTSTTFEGTYALKIDDSSQSIQFSYIGFETQSILVGQQKIVDVILLENLESLEEVQVVAFQKQKKNSVIGSINTINPSELKIPTSNITNAMAGKLAGMISYQRSGEPGADNAEFFIRGVIAHDISAMMEYKNISLKEAAHEVIQKKLKSMGGTGGVIGIDKNLNTVMEFNTKGMYRASCIADSVQVKIYAKN